MRASAKTRTNTPKSQETLRDIRKAQGLTLQQIKNMTGLAPSIYTQYELGEIPMPVNVLHTLSRIFKMTCEQVRDCAFCDFTDRTARTTSVSKGTTQASQSQTMYPDGNVQAAFSANLRALREAAGLTREQLTEALSCGAGSVLNWETKGIVPRVEWLVKISTFFGVPLDSLIGTKPILPPAAPSMNALARKLRNKGRQSHLIASNEDVREVTKRMVNMLVWLDEQGIDIDAEVEKSK